MSFPTFNPSIAPSYPVDVSVEARTVGMELGDGYGQEVADGLNHIRHTASLVWNDLPEAAMLEIVAFFYERGGTLPFYWTIIGQATPKKWKAKDWRLRLVKRVNLYQLTVTFRETFELDV